MNEAWKINWNLIKRCRNEFETLKQIRTMPIEFRLIWIIVRYKNTTKF